MFIHILLLIFVVIVVWNLSHIESFPQKKSLCKYVEKSYFYLHEDLIRERIISLYATLKPSLLNNLKPTSNRKKHVNKYSNFSSEAIVIDPLLAAKELQDRQKELGNDPSPPIRGTTVPMVHGSDIMKNHNTSIPSLPSYKDIIPSDPYTFGYAHIGVILGPHGIKGELKVKLETEFVEERLQENTVLYVKKPNRRTPRPIQVLSSRRQIENIFLVQFQGIKSRFGASALKEYKIYVKSTDRPSLQQDEHLIRDLVDMNCYLNVTTTATGDKIYHGLVGIIAGVVPPDELCDPALAALMHAMLEIRRPGIEARLCLIPFVPSIVLDIDYDHKSVLLDPPAGLLEETYLEERKVVIRGFLPESAIGLTAQDRKFLESNSIQIIVDTS